MFSFILSSPELTSLRFYYCFTLTDEFLEEAALLDRFPNLQCLEFYRCDSVTKEGIDSILNGRIVENPEITPAIFERRPGARRIRLTERARAHFQGDH